MGTPDHGQNIITRGLPKTGEITPIPVGCDGYYQAGWWIGRLNANNRVRFIAKTIGGDDIVLDRATGLMWARDATAAGCNNGAVITWANGINYANGLNFATFDDWRMPNIKELLSLVGYVVIIDAVFTNRIYDDYWSSTTNFIFFTKAWFVSFITDGGSSIADKTFDKYIRCVRKGL